MAPVTARMPVLSLAKDLRDAVRNGHPWIYDRALSRTRPALRPGQLVAVAHEGALVGVGFADPDGPIAVRILEREMASPDHGADRASHDWAQWATERAVRAARCRMSNPALAATDALRVIHGENDYMPGLVVDLYRDTAVVVLDGMAAAAFWTPFLTAVAGGLAAAGLPVARMWRRPVKGAAPGSPEASGVVVRGDEPPEIIEIVEHGARFEVDVRHGQKTGLFLDQRENRQRVRALAAGVEVLNVFSYTGGFSVHAALGGAVRVTSVDSAAPAMAAAERNFARNELAPGDHAFVIADAFEHMREAAQRGERFGLVIVDPPSFAPSERAKPRGMRAYQRLAELALAIVSDGGLLLMASCSSHVTVADMMSVVAAAGARSGRRTRVLEVFGAASDHPVLAGFPEGSYLKLLVVHAE